MALTQVQGGMILASGQSIPKAALPTGSVLQVVNATYSTETTNNTSTYADTGLTAAITPTFSTSKILVLVSAQICKLANNTGVDLNLVRNSTNICHFGQAVAYTAASGYNIIGTAGCEYLDSPATTSSTTYKVQFASTLNTSSARINDNGSVSTITLMEIAA